MDYKNYIRDIPDFPTKGVNFKDITPLLKSAESYNNVLKEFTQVALSLEPDVITAIDARGFFFGPPLALKLNKPFVPLRKAGKLPFRTIGCPYNLEYGDSVLEIHGLENVDHQNEKHSDEEEDQHSHDHENQKHNDNNHSELASAEITALLLTTKSPIANINLPRQINRESSMQAANPSLEITRLTSMLGLGSKSLGLLSTILISIAVLSIFSGLASNLENRMGDLATLRAIGYSTNLDIFKSFGLTKSISTSKKTPIKTD